MHENTYDHFDSYIRESSAFIINSYLLDPEDLEGPILRMIWEGERVFFYSFSGVLDFLSVVASSLDYPEGLIIQDQRGLEDFLFSTAKEYLEGTVRGYILDSARERVRWVYENLDSLEESELPSLLQNRTLDEDGEVDLEDLTLEQMLGILKEFPDKDHEQSYSLEDLWDEWQEREFLQTLKED